MFEYIYVRVKNEVFRINNGNEQALFYVYVKLQKILTEEEQEHLRLLLVRKKYSQVFEMDKLKNMVKRITKEEYNKYKKYSNG